MSHPVNITTGLVLRPVPGPHWVLFRHLFTEEIRAGDHSPWAPSAVWQWSQPCAGHDVSVRWAVSRWGWHWAPYPHPVTRNQEHSARAGAVAEVTRGIQER